MNELIKITSEKIGSETVNTVNARDLWEKLQSKQQFANWIENRISQFGFVEGKDFLIILLKSTGGRPSKEYHLAIRSAKHIAMGEHTTIGDYYRDYFIKCEEVSKKVIDPSNLSKLEILKMAIESEEKRIELEKKIEKQAPLVEFAKQVGESDNTIEISLFAEYLGEKPNNLFKYLRFKKILFYRKINGTNYNVPYSKFIELGYFKVVEKTRKDGDKMLTYPQTQITGKGQKWLSKVLKGGGIDLVEEV